MSKLAAEELKRLQGIYLKGLLTTRHGGPILSDRYWVSLEHNVKQILGEKINSLLGWETELEKLWSIS